MPSIHQRQFFTWIVTNDVPSGIYLLRIRPHGNTYGSPQTFLENSFEINNPDFDPTPDPDPNPIPDPTPTSNPFNLRVSSNWGIVSNDIFHGGDDLPLNITWNSSITSTSSIKVKIYSNPFGNNNT